MRHEKQFYKFFNSENSDSDGLGIPADRGGPGYPFIRLHGLKRGPVSTPIPPMFTFNIIVMIL